MDVKINSVQRTIQAMNTTFKEAAAVTLVLLAINWVQCKHQPLGCVYSWNLHPNGTTCSVHCPTWFRLKFNAYCNFLALHDLSLNYNSSSQILSVPSGTSMGSLKRGSTIPSCYKVTLNEGQYEITSNGFVIISPHLMEVDPHLSTFSSGGNVTICYPSSPQLLQCDVIKTPSEAYEMVNGTELAISGRNYTVSLGDFFIDENKMAVTCADSVTNQLAFEVIPRCNVINVQQNEVRVNADGSITLLKANFTIKNPIHSVNYTEFLLVCVPLSSAFLNCSTKRKVTEGLYALLTNLSVVNFYYDQTMLSPDNYYVTMDGELVSCVSNPNSAMTLSFHVSLSLYYISGGFLILTLIIRFPTFVQTFQGLYLMSHVLCLMAVCFVSGLRLFSATFKAIPCYLTFALNYFFVMATVLWLNIMAYDSWSYFSCIFEQPQLERCKAKGVKRCVVYNAIVWGISSILTAIVLTIDLSGPPFDFNTPFILNVIVPQFPYNYTMWNVCFFNTWRTINLFFSLPLIVFSMVNIAFIVMTIRCIHRASCGTELVNHRRHRQLFKISVRLFIVMGFCWTFDSLFYVISPYSPSADHMWLLVTGIVVIAIQGFLIFIVYCASKQVLQAFFSRIFARQ